MKRYYCFSLLPVLLFIFNSCSTENKSILDNYLSFHNSHNINKSLSLYSEDISFELVGTWIKEGKNEIMSLAEWDAVLNSRLNFYIIRESGDTIFCKGTEQNDWFGGMGIDEIHYDSIIFIFERGLIRKIIAEPTDESRRKISEAFNSAVEYANRSGNSILQDLIPNGKFIYSAETAKKWLKFIGKMKKNKAD